MAICPNETGLLTINGIVLESEAWVILSDLVPMYFIQNYIEADEIHIPGRDGYIPYAPQIGGAKFDLRFMIIGVCDPDGTPYDDPVDGLTQNINLFRQTVVDPLTSDNGLRPATLSCPDGSTRVADVFVGAWQPGVTAIGTVGQCVNGIGDATKSIMHRGVLTIKVPSGQFVAQ